MRSLQLSFKEFLASESDVDCKQFWLGALGSEDGIEQLVQFWDLAFRLVFWALFSDLFSGPVFGPSFGVQFWGPVLGSSFGVQFRGPLFDQNWDPKVRIFGVQFWVRFWGPFLGLRIRFLFYS